MQIPADRTEAPSAGPAVGLGFGLGVLISLATSAGFGTSLATEAFHDPDTYMRLVRLGDELTAGHSLHVVARDASGAGTVIHWSHLLDSLIVLLATPLEWLMPQQAALYWAGVAVGPLSMGALGAMLVWALAPLAERCFLWVAVAAACLAPPVLGYGQAGVVHHHVLLAVVGVALAGWTLRLANGWGGVAAGLALAAWAVCGLWLSPETFPWILMAYGGLGWTWLLRPRTEGLRCGIDTAAAAFPLLVLAVLLADPPPGGWLATDIDRISATWLAFALVCTVTGAAIALGGRRSAILAGTLALALWLAAFPAVLRGTDALIDPGQSRAIFDGIREMQPVRGPAEATERLGTGLLALGLLIGLAWRRRDGRVAYVALCAAAMVALGAQHVRFATYSAVIGAAALPILLTRLTRWQGAHLQRAALCRAGTAVLGILLPWLIPLGVSAASAAPSAALLATGPECHVASAAALLERAAGQVVLADVSDTPELLYRTQVLTVGSLYHRGQAALMRQRAAWTGTEWDLPGAALEATGARYILVCRHAPARPATTTLPGRLARGEVPDWLRPVASEPSGFVLYERLR